MSNEKKTKVTAGDADPTGVLNAMDRAWIACQFNMLPDGWRIGVSPEMLTMFRAALGAPQVDPEWPPLPNAMRGLPVVGVPGLRYGVVVALQPAESPAGYYHGMEPEKTPATEPVVWDESDATLRTATWGDLLLGVFPLARFVRLVAPGRQTIKLGEDQLDNAIAALQAAKAMLAEVPRG